MKVLKMAKLTHEPKEKLIFIGGIFYLFVYVSLVLKLVFHDIDLLALVLFASGFGYTCAICNYFYEISVKKSQRRKR